MDYLAAPRTCIKVRFLYGDLVEKTGLLIVATDRVQFVSRRKSVHESVVVYILVRQVCTSTIGRVFKRYSISTVPALHDERCVIAASCYVCVAPATAPNPPTGGTLLFGPSCDGDRRPHTATPLSAYRTRAHALLPRGGRPGSRVAGHGHGRMAPALARRTSPSLSD